MSTISSVNLQEYNNFDFSILNDNPYNIDKERFFNYKTLKERLSSGVINYDTIKNEDDFYDKAVRFLVRYAYGLFEFITKEKVCNILFDPKSNNSFCGLDSNIIQIGSNLLTMNNIPRQIRVDILTAIVFHEQYHKRYTISDLKLMCEPKKNIPYYDHQETKKFLNKLHPTKLHGIIGNILEDRRIEKLGAGDLPGYSFFFEELRRYGVFLHAKKKFNPENANLILLDFLLIKILLPELESKFMAEIDLYGEGLVELKKMDLILSLMSFDMSFESDLKVIRNVLQDLKNHIESNADTIFSDDFSDIIKETKNIFDIFPKEMQENIEEILKKGEVKYINITCELGGENLNGGTEIILSEKQLERLQKIISEEIKNMEGEREDNCKGSQFNERIEEQKLNLKSVHSTQYNLVQLIDEPIKVFDNVLYREALGDAKNICNNLGFLDSKFSRLIESFELTEGELDEDELYSIGFGNKSIFEESESLPGYSLDFGLLLDESGSMRGKIREAKRAFLAFILSLKDNKHVNLFAYGHTANHLGGVNNDKKFQMYRYYNTIEKFTDWRRIFSATPRSNNADGYAIYKMAEIMKISKNKDKVLCVISDGQPHAEGYGGTTGEQHVHDIVTRLENEGILVIQICMDYIENSPRMFKHYIPYEKSGNFFNNLKKILLGKLMQFSDQI